MTLDKATLQAVKERIMGKVEYDHYQYADRENHFFSDAIIGKTLITKKVRATEQEARQACEEFVEKWIDELLGDK